MIQDNDCFGYRYVIVLKPSVLKTTGLQIHALPRIEDPRGNLSFIEHGRHCPFAIGGAEWIYDVRSASEVDCGVASGRRMVVAMSGSFDIGADAERVSLNRCDRAAVIDGSSALTLDNFSTNSVALVLHEEASGREPIAHEAPEADRSHRLSDVDRAGIIALPRLRTANASRTVAENGAEWLPFDIRRAFYLFDVPADAERGGHSHHQARELIVALTGSFDVVLSDGKKAPRRFTLNRPYTGLYVPTGLWRTLDSFSGGAMCMVLTSEPFSEADYVRDHDEFLRLTAGQ